MARFSTWSGCANLLFLATFVREVASFIDTQPTAVHISYGELPSQMVIRWATKIPTNSSTVEYGLLSEEIRSPGSRVLLQATAMPLTATGIQWNFTDGGPEKANQTLHKVVLDNLQAGATYEYHVGDKRGGWSSKFTFTAMRSTEQFDNDALRIMAFCDMGDQHGLSMGDIQNDVQNNFYDALLHCGDLAYDFDKNNGQTGDDFMADIEPFAAYVPYMVSPGNHESHYNFSHYREFFTMPQWERTNNMLYSFDIGPAHIISYNTEIFFWPDIFSLEHMAADYAWLKADLEQANKNRAERPWIIVMAHRPMYCVVASPEKTCDGEQEASRQGIPSGCADEYGSLCSPSHSESYAELAADQPTFPMEELFAGAGVDLMLYGHVHDYERYWPVYNHTVVNGTNVTMNSYIGPKAPVHITTGAGGNPEMPYGTKNPPGGVCGRDSPWCAFESGYYPIAPQSADFTYSRIKVQNATHLYFEQYSVIYEKVIDHFWVVKETPNYAEAARGPVEGTDESAENPHIGMLDTKHLRKSRKDLPEWQ